jgi:TctA family transporter
MAQQGKAAQALTAAFTSSFVGAIFAVAMITFLAPLVAQFALKFGPPEFFAVQLLTFCSFIGMSKEPAAKTLSAMMLGFALAAVGMDSVTGQLRMTFGFPELLKGFDFLIAVIGLFGIVEIIRNLEEKQLDRTSIKTRFRDLWPSWSDFKEAWKPVIRGTGLGSILGILPGGGAVLASFASYTMEKKIADDPSRFGKGAIEGVAGPEAANNAAAQTSFIPLLTLGLPSNPIMALMMGAMVIQGMQPGSAVMTSRPELFWGMVASMWIGNLMLVVINLPMVGLWVKLLSVPYRLLYPAILLFCVIGVYGLNSNWVMMAMTAVFAIFGYVLVRVGCEPAPMILGFLLGPIMEENLRRSLVLSRGDPMIFLQRPISATLLGLCVLLILITVLPSIRKSRDAAFAGGS